MVNRKSPCSVKKHVRAESDRCEVEEDGAAVMAMPRPRGEMSMRWSRWPSPTQPRLVGSPASAQRFKQGAGGPGRPARWEPDDTQTQSRRWNAMRCRRAWLDPDPTWPAVSVSRAVGTSRGPGRSVPPFKILATTSVLINFRPPVDVEPLLPSQRLNPNIFCPSPPPYINPDPSLRPNPNPARPHTHRIHHQEEIGGRDPRPDQAKYATTHTPAPHPHRPTARVQRANDVVLLYPLIRSS